MKLRLVLKTTTKKNKDVYLKFNIAPTKHLGFINFINLALNQDKPVSISFEKINKKGDKEESKIVGTFKFEGKSDAELEAEIKDREKKRKKQHQKRDQG